MNEPYEAAWEVSEFLRASNIPHVLIGGLAVSRWGEVRLTRDADLTVSVPVEKSREVVRSLTERFESRASDPMEMAAKTRMVLLVASNGIKVDVSLAVPGYEDEVIRRAKHLTMDDGRRIPVCSAEDLIIHKAVAGRSQDLNDMRGIIQRQGKKLDVNYIRHWLRFFAEALENEDVLGRFERASKGPV